MARKPAKKTVSKNASPSSLALKPGLITTAIALGWGALNEPAGFTVESMMIWMLTIGAVALVAHAALVLGAPLLKIFISQFQAAIQHVRREQKS